MGPGSVKIAHRDTSGGIAPIDASKVFGNDGSDPAMDGLADLGQRAAKALATRGIRSREAFLDWVTDPLGMLRFLRDTGTKTAREILDWATSDEGPGPAHGDMAPEWRVNAAIRLLERSGYTVTAPEGVSEPEDAMVPDRKGDEDPIPNFIPAMLAQLGMENTPDNRVALAFKWAEMEGLKPSTSFIAVAREGIDTFPFSFYQDIGGAHHIECWHADSRRLCPSGSRPLRVVVHSATLSGTWSVREVSDTDDREVLNTRVAKKAFEAAKALLG